MYSKKYLHKKASIQSIKTGTNLSDQEIVYHDGVVVAGLFESLVVHAVMNEEYDIAYTFFGFCSGGEMILMMERLIERCEDCLDSVAGFTLELLKNWGFFKEHLDVLKVLVSLVPRMRFRQEELTMRIRELLMKVRELRNSERILSRVVDPTVSILAEDFTVIADQLCLISQEYLFDIKLSEFMGQSWYMKKDEAINLLRFIDFSKNLSDWVKSSIVVETRLEDRVSIVLQCIKIGLRCREYHNYCVSKSITSALCDKSISDLEQTWMIIKYSESKLYNLFEEMKILFSRENDYIIYRQKIEDTGPPAIPFLDAFLKDLSILDESNHDCTIHGGVNYVNYLKILKYAKFFKTSIIPYQEKQYVFEIVPHIYAFFRRPLEIIPSKICWNIAQDIIRDEQIESLNPTWKLFLPITIINGGIDPRIRSQSHREADIRDLEDNIIICEDGTVEAATCTALINIFITPPNPDLIVKETDVVLFVKNILFRHVDPQDVFQLLSEKYESTFDLSKESSVVLIKNYIWKFLKVIIKESYYLIEDDPAIYRSFTELIKSTFEHPIHGIQKIADRLHGYILEANVIKMEPIFRLPRYIEYSHQQAAFDDMDITLISQQICLYEQSLFRAISIDDWKDADWMKEITKYPNLHNFLLYFGRVSDWTVEYLIVKSPKLRYKRLCKLIDLIIALFELMAHNTMQGIFEGLRNESVRQLRLTWEKYTVEHQHSFDRFTEISGLVFGKSLSSYRELLDSHNGPCVPYIGILMQDFRLNSESSTVLRSMSNEKINLLKLRKFDKLLRNMKKWKNMSFPFTLTPKFYSYFAQNGPPSEKRNVKQKFLTSSSRKRIKPKVERKSVPTVNRRCVLEDSDVYFETLPIELLQYCEQAGISEEFIQENLMLVWRLGVWHHYEMFPNYKLERHHEPKWVDEETLERFKRNIEIVSPKVLRRTYITNRLVGEGAFGCVYACTETDTLTQVAVKRISHDTKKDRLHNFYEAQILSSLVHPNILTFLKTLVVNEELLIITEYIDGGSLRDAIRVHQFSDRHAAFIIREVLSGLKYLHELDYVHRDIKSDNIMLDLRGNIKIVDFGLCAEFKHGPRIKILGSPFWIAPEMLNGVPHGFAVDIWALGITCIEIYYSRAPLYHSPFKCMLVAATEGMYEYIPDNAPTTARDFMRLCLSFNPSDRPPAKTLIKHDWLSAPGLSIGLKKALDSIFINDTLSSYSHF